MDDELVFRLHFFLFLRSCPSFELVKRGNRYIGYYTDVRRPDMSFDVSNERVEEFESFLMSCDIEDWYCHYDHPDFFDGLEWNMCYRGEKYGGLYQYPDHFDALVSYIGEIFQIEEFAQYRYLGGSDLSDFEHIAWYAHEVIDSEDSKYSVKLHQERAGEELHKFIHDLDLFVRRNPEYRRPKKLLAEKNIDLDFRHLRQSQIQNVCPATIVSMILAVLELDREQATLGGHSSLFSKCFEDGTFYSWLFALEEISTRHPNPLLI